MNRAYRGCTDALVLRASNAAKTVVEQQTFPM